MAGEVCHPACGRLLVCHTLLYGPYLCNHLQWPPDFLRVHALQPKGVHRHIIIRSHLKCGTCMFLIGSKLPSPQLEPKCVLESLPHSSAFIVTEISMIYCIHKSWVVLMCSENYWPNYLRSHRIVVILNEKSHVCTSPQIYIGYSNETWQGHCYG